MSMVVVFSAWVVTGCFSLRVRVVLSLFDRAARGGRAVWLLSAIAGLLEMFSDAALGGAAVVGR